MSTDYQMVCFTCRARGPIFASSSIAYGYKIWEIEDLRKWLGHRDAIGFHEGHDLRIINGEMDLSWEEDEDESHASPDDTRGEHE